MWQSKVHTASSSPEHPTPPRAPSDRLLYAVLTARGIGPVPDQLCDLREAQHDQGIPVLPAVRVQHYGGAVTSD
jgi:hypothetical protein